MPRNEPPALRLERQMFIVMWKFRARDTYSRVRLFYVFIIWMLNKQHTRLDIGVIDVNKLCDPRCAPLIRYDTDGNFVSIGLPTPPAITVYTIRGIVTARGIDSSLYFAYHTHPLVSSSLHRQPEQ